MIKIPFTVSARTARLIGRENVAHADGAVIELVKNCYDADADFALVIVNPVKKSIIFFDNGHGMSEIDITKKWMHIGTDNKEIDFKSTRGRIKAGAKGIGRFALDRLGQQCTLYTLQKGKRDGYKWEANWNDFEKVGASIDRVFATVDTERNLNFLDILKAEINNPQVFSLLTKYSLKQGTFIKIELSRDEWNEEISQKIYNSLEVLTPPDGQSKFDIFFYNESFKGKFGKIYNESFSDYDYKVIAKYKKNKQRELTIEFHRNEFDYNLIDTAFFERNDMQQYPYDKRTFKKERFTLSSTFYDLMPGFREKDKKSNISDTIGDFTFTIIVVRLKSGLKTP